jgi:hypothetical protein
MSTPFVDAMMPDGSRLHVGIPDITRRHMAVNIRKFVLQAHSLDEFVALGTLTAQAARFLEAAVASGLNILVCGTQAGKTTLLNCLVLRDPRARAGNPVRGGLRASDVKRGAQVLEIWAQRLTHLGVLTRDVGRGRVTTGSD